MSNYVKITDFASKDALATGNPLKLIKGTEINEELSAIQTAVGTKADLASPAFTGNPTAFTQTFGNSSDRLATTSFVQQALAALYPVGSIYTSTVATNPNTLFGFGNWVAFGAGRVMVGHSGTAPYVAGTTGGSADAVVVTHTHVFVGSPLGNHSHGYRSNTTTGNVSGGSSPPVMFSPGTVTSDPASAGTPSGVNDPPVGAVAASGNNANLQPYVVVYMWNRTA